MNTDAANVIVKQDSCIACGVPAVQVFHQSYPELRITDMTIRQAAEHLAMRLESDLDAVSLPARRRRAQLALDDVRAFVDGIEQSPNPCTPRLAR